MTKHRSSGDWTSVAPLSDPVGFGGMFAGVLNGRLVAGGGSQFVDKPLWLGGTKQYSDRIFTLETLDAQWTEHGQRLPRPMAHFASAATNDTIVVAGGMDHAGPLSDVYALSAGAANGDFVIRKFPDLPLPLAYAAGGIRDGRLFIAGGQDAAKAARREVWSLVLNHETVGATWSRAPDLPGSGLFLGSLAVTGREMVFAGGVSPDDTGASVPSRKVYRLADGRGRWETLPDLPEPRAGGLALVPALHSRRILIIGGYAARHTGEPRDHPGFPRQTYVLDLPAGRSALGPILPHEQPQTRDSIGDKGPAPVVAAAGAVWQNHFIVISGEVRASVRTPAVLALPIPLLEGLDPRD